MVEMCIRDRSDIGQDDPDRLRSGEDRRQNTKGSVGFPTGPFLLIPL